MRFDTYIPCELLRLYVKSFVIQEAALEATYKVLPGASLVIGFQYKGKLSRIDSQNEITLSASGITGLHDSFRIFKHSPDIGTVLVYFTDTGATAFFKEPLHELFRESISLDNFMLRSALLTIEEKLDEARTDKERIKVVEDFLISRMEHKQADNLVSTALALIYKSKGDIRIKDLITQLHISQSPLEKRFRQAVGTSPKKFASIVRLKNLIQNYHPESTLTGLGYKAGFFDQAHFIKEFKAFTGETPEKFFQSQQPAG